MLERIDSSYGPLADSVRCGLCGTPHQKGFIVDYRDVLGGPLKQGLLGHNCGETHFGATWKNAIVRLNQEVRAGKVREMFASFLLDADEVQPKLESLLPGLNARKAIRSRLISDAPEFMRRCQEACRNHQGQINHDNEGGPSYVLRGSLFFLQDNAADKVTFLLASIRNARWLAEDPDLKLAETALRLERVGNLKDQLREIEKEAEAGRLALNPENIRKAISASNGINRYSRPCAKLDGTHLFVWLERTPFASWDVTEPEWSKVADLRDLPT